MSPSIVWPGRSDDLLDGGPGVPARDATARPKSRRVLIVDDDADMHIATASALRDLMVEGRPGAGATFRFTLPLSS